jgi:Raf kinase inhibitor-like YbhB/YbcL family protein
MLRRSATGSARAGSHRRRKVLITGVRIQGLEVWWADRDNVFIYIAHRRWSMRDLAVFFTVAVLVGGCAGGSSEQPVHTATETTVEVGMKLSSPAFEPGENIPVRFTCDGSDVSPPLQISDIPEGAVSLVLVMDDPDAPAGVWDHWIAYDVEPQEMIDESVEGLGTPGTNSWGRTGYGGPCPPSGTHRYFFTAYSLDTSLGLSPGADKAAVLEALSGHVLAEATLMGRYSR